MCSWWSLLPSLLAVCLFAVFRGLNFFYPANFFLIFRCELCLTGKARIGRMCCNDCREESCSSMCNSFNGYCDQANGLCRCHQGWAGKTCDDSASSMPMGYMPPMGERRRLLGSSDKVTDSVMPTMPGMEDQDVCAAEASTSEPPTTSCSAHSGCSNETEPHHCYMNQCTKCTDCSSSGCTDMCGQGSCNSKKCVCSEGFKGDNCEISDCDCTKDCKCSNGGTCNAVTKRCECPPGFLGDKCQTVCQSGCCGAGCECQNGGKCQYSMDSDTTTCQCANGFYGSSCEHQCTSCGDQSDANCKCDNGGWCSVGGNCACADNWEGTFCTVANGCQDTTLQQCLTCGAGFFAPNNGSDVCSSCPPGKWGKGDRIFTGICNLCPKGYHASTSGMSACVGCSAGKFSDLKGAAFCTDCPRGKTSGELASVCEECAAGMRSGDNVNEGCVPCAAGLYGTEKAQMSCKACAAGTYNDKPMYLLAGVPSVHVTLERIRYDAAMSNTTTKACAYQSTGFCKNGGACPNDFYSFGCICPLMYAGIQCQLAITKSEPATSCLDCSVGKYAPKTGAELCLECLPGFHADLAKQSNCFECPVGTFVQLSGAENCEKCPAGKVLDQVGSNLNHCKECRVGTYQDLLGKGICKSCTQGRYNHELGSAAFATGCKSCPSGWLVGYESASECEKCTFGKYTNEIGQSSCKLCTVGRFGDQLGRLNIDVGCKSCPSGFFQGSQGAIGCDACDQGTRGTGVGSTTKSKGCASCPVGLYMDQFGQSACKSCPAGKAGPVSGAIGESTCKKCRAGEYQESIGQEVCKHCPEGEYQHESGKAYCLPCIPGTSSSDVGVTECNKCQIGQYSVNVSSLKCLHCPIGFQNLRDGATSCISCSAGKYAKLGRQGECFNCPLGWKRGDSDANLTECLICSRGKTTGMTSSTSCQGCKAGKFGSKDGVCDFCSGGFFQDAEGLTQCKSCPEDTYSEEIGKTSASDCKQCLVERTTSGKAGQNVQESCVCRGANEVLCVDHDVVGDPNCGYYKNATGSCVLCPRGANCSDDGVMLENITATTGFWRPDPALFDSKWSDRPKGLEASIVFVDCAKGIYSGSDGTMLGQSRCCPDETCANPFDVHANQQCKKGFGGPVCASCVEDHSLVGESCNYCEGGPDVVSAFGALGVLGGLWFLVVLMLFRNTIKGKTKPQRQREEVNAKKVDNKTNDLQDVDPSPPPPPPAAKTKTQGECDPQKQQKVHQDQQQHHRHHQHHRKVGAASSLTVLGKENLFNARIADASGSRGSTATEWELVAHQFKIMLTSLQILSAVCITFDDVPWPKLFKNFTLKLSFVNLDLSPLFGLTNCRLALPFLDKMLLHMTLPIVLVGTVFFMYMAFSVCERSKNSLTRHTQHALASKIIITTVLLLYPGICVRVFQVFKCTTIVPRHSLYEGSPPLSVLQQDFRVVCFDSPHMPYVTLAGVCLGVYVLFIPLLLFYLLRVSKPFLFDETNVEKHKEVVASYGSLYLQYEDRYWWWELVRILFLFLLLLLFFLPFLLCSHRSLFTSILFSLLIR